MISEPAGWVAAGLGAGVVSWALRGAVHPRSQLFGPVCWCGPRDEPAVALSFDDGPHPDGTPAVLDRLRALDVKATFFLIGRYVDRWPDLARRIAEEGHLLANHSYDHAHGGLFGLRRYWIDQIRRTNDAIEKATSRCPTMFRPPMGLKHHSMFRAVRHEKMTMVTWSLRGRDGLATTALKIRQRLEPRLGAGDIVLLHDGVDPNRRRDTGPTVEVIGPLVEVIRSRGLALRRLDGLLEAG